MEIFFLLSPFTIFADEKNADIKVKKTKDMEFKDLNISKQILMALEEAGF